MEFVNCYQDVPLLDPRKSAANAALTPTLKLPKLTLMNVPLQPEKEAQLAQIAAKKGLNPDQLAEQVITRYLEDDTRFVEAVNLGLAAAERGEFVEHEDVGKKLKEILRG
jgi:predicted transcriptional regulator